MIFAHWNPNPRQHYITNFTPCHARGPLTTPREVTPNATPRPSASSPTVTVRSNASVSGVPNKSGLEDDVLFSLEQGVLLGGAKKLLVWGRGV